MTTKRIFNLYHIRLRGKLDPDLASWFPELSLAVEANGDTLLRGELPDQSALLGILFRIHNLNLFIQSIETEANETLLVK